MLLIRWLKRTAYMNRRFRQYIGYAAGEILLVIVGILIALQIDNWNSERQDAATLDNYLRSIARNMSDDIVQLERLHAARNESIMLSHNAQRDLLHQPGYSIEQVAYLSAALGVADSAAYFNANTSSFDALKNSGVLDKLQGRDIEELLSRYYIGVTRVLQLEQEYNARIRAAQALPRFRVPEFVEGFAITDPSALEAGRFDELQPYYRAYFSSEYTEALFAAASNAATILREYQALLTVARLYIDLVEEGRSEFDDAVRERLASLDAVARGGGYPEMIRNGVLAAGYYDFGFGYPYYTDGVFVSRRNYVDYRSMQTVGDAFRFSFKGGAPWAVFFLTVRENSGTIGRPAADFSRFDRLLIEARGAEGGERILVHLKDKTDPDDGQQTTIEIVLEKDWKRYEFALSDFATADISALHLPLGFTMLEQQSPLTFFIRTARFLEPGRQSH